MSKVYLLLKKLVIGSRWEAIARRLHRAVSARLNTETTQFNDLSNLNTAYDAQTRAVMSRVLKGNSNCIDVGAHRGVILRDMVDMAPAGSHCAFEPILDCCEYLKRNFSNVSVYPLALSDTVGEVTFQHVTTNPAYSGLRKRRYDRPDETVVEITVHTDLLDNIVPHSFDIDFIKIDVEGAELQVLRGAAKTIRRCKPVVVFEHGLGAADHYGTTPAMLYDYFDGCGYRIFLMQDWLVGNASLSKEELDDQFYTGTNFYFLADASEHGNA